MHVLSLEIILSNAKSSVYTSFNNAMFMNIIYLFEINSILIMHYINLSIYII